MATEFVDIPANTSKEAFEVIEYLLNRWKRAGCGFKLSAWDPDAETHPSGIPKTVELTTERCT